MLPYFLLVVNLKAVLPFAWSLVDPGRLYLSNLTPSSFSLLFPQPHLKFPSAFLTIIGNDLLFMPLQICCKWQFWTIYHPQASLCITFGSITFSLYSFCLWVSFLGLTVSIFTSTTALYQEFTFLMILSLSL